MQNRSLNKTSRTSRNPHHVEPPPASKIASRCSSKQQLIFEQWKQSEGAPISQFAASGVFDVQISRGSTENQISSESNSNSILYPLSDVRLWGPREFQPQFNQNKMRLEFFFDGEFDKSDEKLKHNFETELRRKLEENIGIAIQEGFQERLSNARKWDKRTVQKDLKDGLDSQTMSNDFRNNELENPLEFDENVESTSEVLGPPGAQQYKSSESVTTFDLDLSIESYREAGCMIQFFVARTTVSMNYAQLLGQQCFPDFFQGSLHKWKEEIKLPMPFWMKIVYVILGLFMLFVISCWYRGFVEQNQNLINESRIDPEIEGTSNTIKDAIVPPGSQ